MDASWLRWLPKLLSQYIADRQNLQAILKNSSWLIVDKVVRMLVGLFVGIWVARYLGPESFGQLNYAVAFVSLFTAAASVASESIVVRELVSYPEHKNEIMASAFCLKLIGCIAALFISQLAIWKFGSGDKAVLLMVCIVASGMIFQAVDVVDYWFQSQMKSKFTILARGLAFILFSFVKIVLIVTKGPLITFALTVLAEAVVGSVGLIVVYRINGHFLRLRFLSVKWAKKITQHSFFLMLSGFAVAFYMKIDQVMISNMVGNRELGVYSVATRLSEIWYFLAVAISSSVFPSLIESKKRDILLFDLQYRNLCWAMAFLSISIALVTGLSSEILVDVLYGSEFKESAPILSLHIWSVVFVYCAFPTTLLLTIDGLQRYVFASTLLGATCNLGLNLYLIPLYGGVGAAIATVVSYFVSGYLAYFIFPQTRYAVIIITKSIVRPWVSLAKN